MAAHAQENTPLVSQKIFEPEHKPLRFPLPLFPEHVRPYLELIRLEKPTGTILMTWPYVWGLTLAAYRTASPLDMYGIYLLKCLVAGFLVRSSCCTLNDITDRHLDARVERTKGRPLPSGRISVFAATMWLLVQWVIGIIYFYYALPPLGFLMAMIQMLPVFAVYPLLKYYTHWPQAWLGLAMNVGVITAFVSMTNEMDWSLMGLMMAGCWSWTMTYDTIYACQDMKDDLKAGAKSTAILFGAWIRPILYANGVMFVAMLAGAGVVNHQGPAYFVLTVGGTALQLVWQLNTVDLADSASCLRAFNRNGDLGWIVWGGLIFDYLLRIDALPFRN